MHFIEFMKRADCLSFTTRCYVTSVQIDRGRSTPRLSCGLRLQNVDAFSRTSDYHVHVLCIHTARVTPAGLPLSPISS